MRKVQPIVYSLMALYDALGGRFADLSRPQLRLLAKVASNQPTVSELADQLNISSPGVTQMIDKLQGKGYVERQSLEKDQRVVRVRATADGLKALTEAEQVFESRVEALLSPLSAEERTQLLALLQKVGGRQPQGGETEPRSVLY